MKKLLAIIFLIAAGLVIWYVFFKEKPDASVISVEPIKIRSHSGEFNQSINSVLSAYFDLKSSFVDADTTRVKQHGKRLLTSLDSIKIQELSQDTSGILQSATMLMGDIKNNSSALLNENDLTEMREDFRMISENLYPFLKTIKYEGSSLYWQNCPMAFGEGKEANWISNTKEIINPYLGKNHPEFKSSMLHCGEIKDTIK
jgi:hypothetical protein